MYAFGKIAVTPTKPLGRTEFIVLVATLVSLVALTTDVMLPALPDIGRALNVAAANDIQLVIIAFFVGLGCGQLIAGPVSDSLGRKPVIFAGLAVFALGCVLSAVAADFNTMLAGRVLQAMGAAGPRIVTVALVRDLYAGRGMAQIMSFAMSVFIIVPVVAPAMGQAILYVSDWQMIFVCLLVMACVGVLWLAVRQPETLTPDKRRRFSLSGNLVAAAEVFRHRASLGYMIAAGMIFGAFFAYLSTAQQIFDVVYGAAELFALYFAILAVGLGAASFTNGKLVMKLGMRRLSSWALGVLTVWCLGALALIVGLSLVIPLWLFMAWAMVAFFCLGMLFSNFNALAMEPLGHIAGVGAAVIGSVTTLISSVFAVFLGQLFDGTVVPLIAGFAVCGVGAMITVKLTERGLPAETDD